MLVAVVHTVASVCGCAEAVAAGLHALGHEVRFFDSESIGFTAREISESCDLVIDHTDTFCGSGLLRPFVRWILESRGARLVGSDAKACLLADDKIAAKACLADAGVPVPPGVTASSADKTFPSWLKLPVVLKPAFEHMSRGLVLAQTENEARAAMAELIHQFKQSLLVERFIPGREFSVALLEEENGLCILPPLEWQVLPDGSAVLTGAYKLSDVSEERQDALRADLPPELLSDLEGLSRLAFKTLGLRDYARFDIRLSSGGTFYFLEANTTPSLEPFEALALSAKWNGVTYAALVEKILASALRRYGPSSLHVERKRLIDFPTGSVELVIPYGVHDVAPSTIDLAKMLDVRKGERVLDLGCGTGVLAIAAAKLGARRVVATDIDPRALEATRGNALVNGVDEKIALVEGSWFEALRNYSCDHIERFDVVIATPPQTPGPHPFGPQYGGHDGLKHPLKILEEVPLYLEPDHGRLWLLLISLADSSKLLDRLHKRFHQVTVVNETRRYFTGAEYHAYDRRLMNHFLEMRASGRSDFQEAGMDSYYFRNLFICASRMRKHCGS